MAGLGQHAQDGRHEVVLIVARGDAHVIGHAAAEGVQRDVEAAMPEIEADGGHEAAGQRLLLLARAGSLTWQRCRLAPLPRQDVSGKSAQEADETIAHAANPGGAPEWAHTL